MKNVLIAGLLAMTLGSVAQAETFTCGFTEPFLTITYQTGTQVLSKKDSISGKVQILRNVSFLILAPGQYSLRNSAGKEVARITLDNNGSDGMSSTLYPYTIRTNLISGANGGVGGCSSVALPTKPGQP